MPDIFVAPKREAAKVSDTLNKATDLITKPVILDSPAKNLPPQNSSTQNGKLHLFSSFCRNPKGVSFQNQEADEEVILFVRKDLITNFPWIFFSAVITLAPVFILPLAKFFNMNFFINPRFLIFSILFYYLFVITYIFVNFITWYFNISIVTPIRIVDVDLSGLVYKNVSATKIDLVQDVSYSQIGVIRNFFNYGDVLVQTAGTTENFEFVAVPQPDSVVHAIEDLIGKEGNVL